MTLREDARAVLSAWQPTDAVQSSLRKQYLAHLDAHDDAMWRSCHPDHLTASALVMSDDGRYVALTRHRKLGRWLQFGGHCETADASLADAAARETREESGIATFRLDPSPLLLSRHEVPCGPLRPAHHLDVQYLAVVPARTQLIVSSESTDVRWFAVEALPPDTDDTVRALTAAAMKRLRESPRHAPGARIR